jgi:hypothetical protein
VEKNSNGNNVLTLSAGMFAKNFPNVTQNILDYHIELLAERKMIKAKPHQLGWLGICLF